jgi:hypothetical protein
MGETLLSGIGQPWKWGAVSNNQVIDKLIKNDLYPVWKRNISGNAALYQGLAIRVDAGSQSQQH